MLDYFATSGPIWLKGAGCPGRTTAPTGGGSSCLMLLVATAAFFVALRLWSTWWCCVLKALFRGQTAACGSRTS